MKKSLRKFFSDGGGAGRFSLSYYSPDVGTKWTLDIEADDSLQLVYERTGLPPTYDPATNGPKKSPDEEFWLYLSPQDAAVLGAALVAWAAARGECA